MQKHEQSSIRAFIRRHPGGTAAGLYLFFMLWVFLPSFGLPPRSDYWPAFFFFRRIDALLGGWAKWRCLFTHDPLINVTFRPLSFLYHYLWHQVIGAHFVYYNILNFAMFYTNGLLLYAMSRRMGACRKSAALCVGLALMLFSHFDLICWGFHSHIILALNLFLLGFLSVMHAQKTGKRRFLTAAAALFLGAMFLYETFILWPLAAFLLVAPKSAGAKARYRDIAVMCAALYIVYFALYFLDRAAKAQYMDALVLSGLLRPSLVLFNFCAVFFNIAYNNVLLAFAPHLAFPLRIDENLNMGGWLLADPALNRHIVIIGAAAALLSAAWLFALCRRKGADKTRLVCFWLFLVISQTMVLFHLKSLVNPYPYNLLQFRFQYVPNTFLACVAAIVLADTSVLTSRRALPIIWAVIVIALALNVHATRMGLHILDAELNPLKTLLLDISRAIDSGKVSPQTPLYLGSAPAERFGALCWNREMGARCMRGTYEWIFPHGRADCFAPPSTAVYTIDGKSFRLIKITAANEN